MCVSRADTTCLPVQSCLGLYMVGGGVIISSIEVTISVPVREGWRGRVRERREGWRGRVRERREGEEERERKGGRGGGTGSKGMKKRRYV
jgi:hypothetical protein